MYKLIVYCNVFDIVFVFICVLKKIYEKVLLDDFEVCSVYGIKYIWGKIIIMVGDWEIDIM